MTATSTLCRPGNSTRLIACSLALSACLLSCALIGCGGKNTAVSTPPPPAPAPLATATFGPPGSSGFRQVPLDSARQHSSVAEIMGGFQPSCTLLAGNAPMVYTAGSSSTWFGVTPQFGNLQPNGTTAIGISSIVWSNVVLGAVNNGFVIVTAQGYNQLTGFTFSIGPAGTDALGNPWVRIGYTCP